jgi:hypothetical protein
MKTGNTENPINDQSEKFMTRFYQSPYVAQKLASAVDAFITSGPEDRGRAEELLRATHLEIAQTQTRRLRKEIHETKR